MNNSSSSPIPSALAPSQPEQQEAPSSGQDMPNPFAGLFDTPKLELAPGKAPAQGPSPGFQVRLQSRASACMQSRSECMPAGMLCAALCEQNRAITCFRLFTSV